MSHRAIAPDTRVEDARAISEPGRYRLRLGIYNAASEATEWSVTSAPFDVQ
jgi:hypothetical protein